MQATVYEAVCVVKYGKDLSFAKSTKFEGIGESIHKSFDLNIIIHVRIIEYK